MHLKHGPGMVALLLLDKKIVLLEVHSGRECCM